MILNKYTFLLFTLLLLQNGFTQATNFNTQRNWSLNKKEFTIGFGGTNFLGDLGGTENNGKDYSLRDLNLSSTSIGGSLAYRYRFHPYYATSTILNIGLVKGNDALSDNQFRNSRNLSFRSPLINLSQRIEVIVLAKEKIGRRFNIPGLKGFKDRNEQLYLFTGIGATYYNPKALYNGSYVALRPLKTEGQGLPGGPAEYKRITATIPFGLGFRVGINRMWRIGMEFTYVKTFSDYIDDVSGTYYNNADLMQLVGPESAALADRSGNGDFSEPNAQRGDKQKDAIFYANLTVVRNLTYKQAGPRGKIRFQKYRAKF